MDDHGLLALQGPKAVDALTRMGLTPLQPGWPTVGELVFMQASPYDWNGVPVSVSRSGYTGEDGFEISRSEEHTSELQSLMRNSYAVLCLTKKNRTKNKKQT